MWIMQTTPPRERNNSIKTMNYQQYCFLEAMY